MKKVILMVAAMVLLAACQASADPVVVGHGAGYDGGQIDYTRIWCQGQGGEFTILPDNAPASRGFFLDNSSYADVAKGKGGNARSFQSFCVETDEYIYDNLNAWVSTQNAALTAAGSHAWQGGSDTNNGDDLNPKTAWLYTQFATSNLTGYNYSDTGTGLSRSQTAGALQQLIWTTEGETGSSISLNTPQQTLISNWNTQFAASGWTGIGNVRVVQLYQSSGSDVRQDQLYLIPAPAAIGLGMLGLVLVGWLKRRVG